MFSPRMEMTPAEKAEREAWLKKLQKSGKPLSVKRWGEPPPPRASLSEDASPRKQSKKLKQTNPKLGAKPKLTKQTSASKGISLSKNPPKRRTPGSKLNPLPKSIVLNRDTPVRPQLTPPMSDDKNSSNNDGSSSSSSSSSGSCSSSSHSNYSSELGENRSRNSSDIIHIIDDDDDDDDNNVQDNNMLDIECKRSDDESLVPDPSERVRLLNLMDNLVKIQSDFLNTFKQHLSAFERTYVSPRVGVGSEFRKLYSYLDDSTRLTKGLKQSLEE